MVTTPAPSLSVIVAVKALFSFGLAGEDHMPVFLPTISH